MAENKEPSEASSFNPDTSKVIDLKRFLRDHGQHVTGTKGVLVARAKGVFELGLTSSNEIRENETESARVRNLERFVTPLGEDIPNPEILKSNWTGDVVAIPEFRHGELYNYLVLSNQRTFDSGCMKAKRQLKAKVFYEDGHVHSVVYHEITTKCSHCYVKARVIPSIPTEKENKKPDYTTWVCLSKVSGRVHAAGCSCSAGEGESCNHVAALLYALVDITEKKADGLTASTSSQCKWIKPRKRKLSPKKSQEIVFKKQKVMEHPVTTLKSNKSKKSNAISVEPVDVAKFSVKLKSVNPHAAFLLSSESAELKTPDTVHTEPNLIFTQIDVMYADNIDLKSPACEEKFNNFVEQLVTKFDKNVCTDIENKTRGQGKNTNWIETRKGRITSSNFGLVCKKKVDTPPESTIKTVLGYREFQAPATEWGKRHEPAARRVYAREMKSTHKDLQVTTSGLIVDPKLPHFGSSPDGLVTCDHCSDSQGVLEIKCPYKYRNKSPVDAAKDPMFCSAVVDGKLKLKLNHNYYYQVQGQLGISKRKWCDFYIWTLQGTSVERIHFNESFWSDMVEKLTRFYRGYIVPELFSNRVKREKTLSLE